MPNVTSSLRQLRGSSSDQINRARPPVPFSVNAEKAWSEAYLPPALKAGNRLARLLVKREVPAHVELTRSPAD